MPRGRFASLGQPILKTPEADVSEKMKIFRAVRDGVFHEEQVRIWAEEIAAGLSPYLNIETYEDGLDINAQIEAVLSGHVRERICEAILESN
jgi:hypothetical protein